MQHKPVIELIGVTKSFTLASGTFQALKQVSLSIPASQLIAITGKSGSGKSTLLNLITGIDKPTTGSITVNDVRIDKLSESALASWRGRNIGVVFQFFQLLPTLTILENVMLPMEFCDRYPKAERKNRALQLLEQVDIRDQANKFPAALSGGQQQRAAIARALANDPPIIVADEPTGNLDSQTASAIFQLFAKLAQAGKTVIVVTHEKEFSAWFKHTIAISDGVID
ncbi:MULTISPECIES: ABC transporter ATP-binding protein [unclassified Spirosoma]|uniref:ABC transporter ATP-binding protein n=1 Tax=unclassified Spirosoma TaxID=2621999 RepID=UPI0009646FA2|nr:MULTISPECIES: ABC transporter ATP-binding protein [unclassified Spirosoma]MBN8822048.1 ABC transporter ATP-binding protein [Spirosoma sp.]OJW80454.1 MAG: ABC transporter ATP-binding protein [Spirosoma sp. 48-14]